MTKKVLLLGLMLALFLWPSRPALAQPPEIENAWGNDSEWEMLVPLKQPAPFPSPMASHAELWGIGAIDVSDPQSPGHPGIGAHDHVIYVPPGNKGEYTAIWHVILLVPHPTNAVIGTNVLVRTVVPPGILLAYAVSYDAGTTWVNLTSAETVEAAVNAGLLTEVDTGFAFLCPARPIKP